MRAIHHVTRGWVVENILVLPLVILVTGIVSYWALVIDRIPPITLTEGVIAPKTVNPGERIFATWKVDDLRKGACSAVVSREIIDSTNVVWRQPNQQIIDVLFPENEDFIARETIIPFGAAWGDALYRVRACFRCSGVSLTSVFPVCKQWREVPFTVSPPKQ